MFLIVILIVIIAVSVCRLCFFVAAAVRYMFKASEWDGSQKYDMD